MLKVKDNTTKQDLSVQNCQFWDDKKIKDVLINLNCIRNGTIYINNVIVQVYNELEDNVFPKSNASFVKRVRKLNKEGYFDDISSDGD